MKFSLNRKAILLNVCIAAVISILAIVIYDSGIHNVMESQYEKRSIEITRLVAEDRSYVYLIDAAYDEACPVGSIDPLYTTDLEVLEDPMVGMSPTITNTPEYGWLLATGMPVVDEQGEVIAFAAVDISMNEIVAQQYHYLVYVALAFLTMTVLVCVLSIYLVNRTIVRPINILTDAASQYAHNRKVFSELNMTRSDEIGMLARSMTHMEEEINGYISNLERTTNDLIAAREHAEQMDRASNIDALTKVRNKRAYDIEVEKLNEGTQPYAVIMVDVNGLKRMNDTYGHEKGDISINTVCRIICRIFKHSQVFRVGGDEFVVILEQSDYEERDALTRLILDEFHRNADDASLPPWERVSAAVGCAVYDRAVDDGVDSVLKRADAAMYENKRAWKESR